MSEILTDFSPGVLAAVIDDSHTESFRYLGRSPRAEIEEAPDLVRLVTGLPHPLFNGVFRPQLAAENIDARIETAMAPFRARGLPMYWWVGPVARPADLGARLEAHGLTHVGAMPGMAADLHALNEATPTPEGFTIETVDDPETLAIWGQVTSRSFGIPEAMDAAWLELSLGAGLGLPLRYYLGRWNGTPVATSLMFLTLGVAGLFAVATTEQARRQGFGAAITRAPLIDAREMGYRIGILSASPMGFSVYQRLGFREYCKLGLYQWQPPPATGEGAGGSDP